LTFLACSVKIIAIVSNIDKKSVESLCALFSGFLKTRYNIPKKIKKKDRHYENTKSSKARKES